jgi:ceramide glucosyltransferase
VLVWILLTATGVAVTVYVLGLVSARRHLASKPAAPMDDELPPVSILKPIKGLEEQLEPNLRSFFTQDYPGELELVFACTEQDDPAMTLARRLANEYPNVPCRFVQSDGAFGLNPKVANLAGALEAARYDLVMQSDANVRIPRDYLRRVVTEMRQHGASLLSSPVVGIGERSPGAAMENLHLGAYVAPAMCMVLRFADVRCVVGKTMLFSRGELRELGGLEQVRDILCEDYILGRTYQRAGREVVLSTTPIENVNERNTVRSFVSRHARWLKMRAVIHLPSFLVDPLGNPLALAALTAGASGLRAPFVGLFAAITIGKMAGDRHLMRVMRGHPARWRDLPWIPVKDLALLPIWMYSAVSRTVKWRGRRLKFGRDTRLYDPDRRRSASDASANTSSQAPAAEESSPATEAAQADPPPDPPDMGSSSRMHCDG